MERTLKVIGIIGAITILLLCAYQLGTTQAETITEVQTIEKVVEAVPDGYIDTTTEEFYNNYVDMRQVTDYTTTADGLQLYLKNGNGYYFER